MGVLRWSWTEMMMRVCATNREIEYTHFLPVGFALFRPRVAIAFNAGFSFAVVSFFSFTTFSFVRAALKAQSTRT